MLKETISYTGSQIPTQHAEKHVIVSYAEVTKKSLVGVDCFGPIDVATWSSTMVSYLLE